MFDPELLRSFAAVAECGGFTRAAERLHLTQSTVSSQIKRLEEKIGRSLLNRTTRHVALTPEGEMLLEYARSILRLHEAARRQLETVSLDGMVRLGTSEDFASVGLARALALFHRVHPRVRLEVEIGISGALLASLDAGDIDMVLGKRPLGDTRGELLWRESVVWAFGREFALDPEEPLPLALFPEPCVYRDAALRLLREQERAYQIVYVSPSYSGLKAAAAAGFAITPLPVSMMSSELRVVGPDEGAPALPDGEFVLFRRSGEGNPVLDELALALRAVRL